MQTNLLKPKAINVEQLGLNRAKVTDAPKIANEVPRTLRGLAGFPDLSDRCQATLSDLF